LTKLLKNATMLWMKRSELLAAPRVDSPARTASKWEEEHRAFLRLRASLLQTHAGQYVAVHEGKVVDAGEDKIGLGLRVYSKFGYVPIYVGRVTSERQAVVRVPSPRKLDGIKSH
jgi:hypothetical protein